MALGGRIAIVALTPGGAETARRLAALLPDVEIFGRAGRVADCDSAFTDLTQTLQTLFSAGRPIVGICAAGILIRALAPRLRDKRKEPAVIALAEDASVVVPLLGGHQGGNRLAQEIAAALGASAAITTAGDLRFGVVLDDPPPGWRLANPEHHKAFAAALLAGATVKLVGMADWLGESRLVFADDSRLVIRVTERLARGSENELVYHPATLAVGVGCERGVDAGEVLALVRDSLASHGLAEASVAGIFSIDLKSDEPALHALAESLGVPLRFFDAKRLEAEAPRLANPSDLVFREVGCHGVAEGAALAATGAAIGAAVTETEDRLIVPKIKSKRATCAVARAVQPILPLTLGRARGSLAIVGIGPGDPVWRSPEASMAIDAASDLVGYELYLDLLGPAASGKTRHDYALGEEALRVRAALDLAAAGRDVALICSGDPGIYAMAALVFELLEGEASADWSKVSITVVPGISALQAAAARIGAPLGHDFCAVSLSDLMTPWSRIEARLQAAGEGDFVVALYNPVSRKRRWQLVKAVEILRRHRAATTPVVIARNLGRDGEEVSVVTLDQLSAEGVDMMSLVLIGSSETRSLARGDGSVWVYTPRGYGAKSASSSEDAA